MATGYLEALQNFSHKESLIHLSNGLLWRSLRWKKMKDPPLQLCNSPIPYLFLSNTAFLSGSRKPEAKEGSLASLCFCPCLPCVRYRLFCPAAASLSWHPRLGGETVTESQGFTFPGHRPFPITALETSFTLNYKSFLGDGGWEQHWVGCVWRTCKCNGEVEKDRTKHGVAKSLKPHDSLL